MEAISTAGPGSPDYGPTFDPVLRDDAVGADGGM